MRGWGRASVAGACGGLLVSLCAFVSQTAAHVGADFIVTAAPVYVPLAELQGEERFPRGAQLLLVRNDKVEPLVSGFAATADADVSSDAKFILFAGKRTATDPWQIWELDVAEGSVRKVITTDTDAEHPLYLPGGRMVWAARGPHGFQIESGEDGHPPKIPFLNPTAGPGVLPLTYIRSSAFPLEIMQDGRILFESGFPLGAGHVPELYLVYADGSGVEAYRCDHGRARWGGSQLASGDLVFTHGSSLARFTSVLAHEAPVAAPRAEYAGHIAETASGAWLVSARKPGETHFAIDLWMPGASSLAAVLAEHDENVVEPVLLQTGTPPRRFPSGLHPWDSANLLTLDARISLAGDLRQVPASVRLETLESDNHVVVNGDAPIASDGSFFVKVPGDRPIRFLLLDRNGRVLRSEHGWFWARGGEQRICVGCHASPALSPENRVPGVLLRTTTPADLTGSLARIPKQSGPQGGSSR
jgi:Hydrazine synthase alpha subunit middle domain